MSWMTASPQFTRSHRVGIHDTVKSYECVAIKFFSSFVHFRITPPEYVNNDTRV